MNVRYIWTVGLMLSFLWAQSLREIDSLQQLLRKNRQPDTTLLTTYITLAKLHLSINEWQALEYARQAFPLAQKLKDARRQVLSLYYQASALYYLKSYDQSSNLLMRAESLIGYVKEDIPLRVQILNLKAALAENFGNTVEAQSLYEEALALARTANDPRTLIMTLINTSEMYVRLGTFALAEETLQEAIRLAENTREREYLRNALKTQTMLYLKQGRTQEAIATQEKILAIARQSGIPDWIKDAYGFAITEGIRAGLPQVEKLLLQAEKDLGGETLLWAELLNWIATEGFLPAGAYSQAKDLLGKALQIARKQQAYSLSVKILLNLAGIYSRQALYPQAMEHLLEARRLCETHGDSTLLPLVLNNLGEIYYSQNEPEKAAELFSLAADYANLAPQLNFPFQVASNLGVVQIKLGNIEAARNLLRESLILAEEAEAWGDAVTSCINLANLELQQGRKDQAEKYLRQAFAYAQRSRDPYKIASLHITRAALAFEQGQWQTALNEYEQARMLLEPLEAYTPLADVYEKLILVYGKLGRHREGYRYIQPLLEALQRLSNEESTRALTRLELNYLHQKEREEQERQIEAEKLRAEKARQITGVIVISALILIAAAGGFSFFLYRANLREREINAQLAERNRLIEEQKALLEQQHKELEQAKQEIDESIEYARRIQLAILPDLSEFYERFPESFVYYLPRDVVSGDFYFYYTLSPTQSLLAVADCTGHGVPGAFMSMIGTTLLNRLAQEEGIKDPAFLLERLDEELRLTLHQALSQEQIKDGMDIALCLIDSGEGVLRFGGARRPLFVFTPEGEFIEIKGSRRGIGGDVLGSLGKFESHVIPLRVGLSLYLFTDGIVDQFGWEKMDGQPPRRTKLMMRRLRDLLMKIYQRPAAEQKAFIDTFLTEWRGDIQQMDDICIIGMRYTG